MAEAVALDTLSKPAGPALSATSDMPVVEPAQADPAAESTGATEATEAAPAEEAKPATGAEEKTGAEDVDATGSEEPGSKDETPAWMKREITKARNRQREAERLAQEQTNRLDQALKALERVTGDSASAATKRNASDDPRPARDAFDNPDSYEAALIEWSSRQAAKSAKAEAEKERVEAERRSQIEAVQRTWSDKVAKAAEKFPDFDDVVYADDLKITPVMSNVLQFADNGPDVAYHLGKHPDEARRISELPAPQQALEIGKLAASLVEKPQVSKAPPPVRPVRAQASAVSKAPDEMSMDEYAAYAKDRDRKARARA